MRRTASVTVLILFAMLFNITAFAQKGRRVIGPGTGITVKEATGGEPVRFQTTDAFSDGRGAWLKWTMETEKQNFGFNVYRVVGGQKQLATTSMIPGSAGRIGKVAVSGTEYSFFDLNGALDTVYLIESEDMAGRAYTSNQFNVTRVNDLTPIAGYSSEHLAFEKSRATGMVEIDRPIGSMDVQSKLSANQMRRAMDTQRALAAQSGVKIAIRKNGMYRVTRAQLEAAGFDVNASSALWQLFVRGGQIAMNVGGAGDYIEFYGKGIDEIESDTQIYYLIVGSGPGFRWGSRNVFPSKSLPSANFQYQAVRAPKTTYINTILNGENTNFFGPGVGSLTPTTINFNLFGLDVSNRRNPITIEFQGHSLTPHSVGITLNGLTLPAVTGSFDTKFSRSYVVSPAFLREGVNTLEVISQSPGDSNLFNSITIDYRRKYIAEQNQLFYLNENFRDVDITGFASANIRVFDMTDDGFPTQLNGPNVIDNGGSFSVHIPQYRSRMMMGVEDSGLLQPLSVTPNWASTLSAPTNDADLIIVAYKDWLVQAEAWADYRRSQGIDVKVVQVEDIYDEFNFGSQSYTALKGFFNYAKNNWNTAPGYILLLGDASYDPRNFEGNGYLDYVPSRLVNTLYTELPSDDSLVDFNSDGLAEISIGRIVGRSPADFTRALSRVQAFETPAMQDLNRGALCASDLPIGFDFEAMCQRITQQLPVGMPITLVNRGQPDANNTIITGLNTGPYLVNYSGHGTVGVWAVPAFFGNTRVPELRNNDDMSIYTMLTCLNGYFINPTSPISLGENLMKSEFTDTGTHHTGAIAVWASTGLTTPDVQEIMATRFYHQIGLANPNFTRLGDFTRDAKSVLIGGQDVLNSWVLMGDPMLQVRQPLP